MQFSILEYDITAKSERKSSYYGLIFLSILSTQTYLTVKMIKQVVFFILDFLENVEIPALSNLGQNPKIMNSCPLSGTKIIAKLKQNMLRYDA